MVWIKIDKWVNWTESRYKIQWRAVNKRLICSDMWSNKFFILVVVFWLAVYGQAYHPVSVFVFIFVYSTLLEKNDYESTPNFHPFIFEKQFYLENTDNVLVTYCM